MGDGKRERERENRNKYPYLPPPSAHDGSTFHSLVLKVSKRSYNLVAPPGARSTSSLNFHGNFYERPPKPYPRKNQEKANTRLEQK